MSRMIDRLLSYGATYYGNPNNFSEEAVKIVQQELAQAQVLDISNVANYFAQMQKPDKMWRLSDFPNLAPPFPAFWMEYSNPYHNTEMRVNHIGVFFMALDIQGTNLRQSVPAAFLSDQEMATGDRVWQSTSDPKVGWAEGVRWIVDVLLFSEEGEGQIHGPRLQSKYLLKEDGTNFLHGGRVLTYLLDEPPEELTMPLVVSLSRNGVYPALLAISLLHCKNVSTILNEPQLNRAARRRKEKPLVKYYTLEIEPMKQVLRTQGKSEEVGLKKALHICRGHFKDYRERGLFGRKKGIFWWDNHVRGHLSEGVVIKDYAVKEPMHYNQTKG